MQKIGVLGKFGLVLLVSAAVSLGACSKSFKDVESGDISLDAKEKAAATAILKKAGLSAENVRIWDGSRSCSKCPNGFVVSGGHITEATMNNATLGDLSMFAAFPKLKELVVNRGGLNSLDGLQNIDLKILVANNNKIQDLNALQKCNKMQKLSMHHNSLNSLAGIERCAQMEAMDVSHNKLTSLEGVDKLPKLKKLVANNNQITNADKFITGSKIKEYDLRHNKITDMPAVLMYRGSIRTGSVRSRYSGGGGYGYGK